MRQLSSDVGFYVCTWLPIDVLVWWCL